VSRVALVLAAALVACSESRQPPPPLSPDSPEIVTGCVSAPNSDATGFIVRRDGQLLQWFRYGPQPIALEQTQALRVLDPEETQSLFDALGEMNFAGIAHHKRGPDVTCYVALRSEADGVIHEVSWSMRGGAPLPVAQLFERIDALTRPETGESG
jgi:hypothetical protein